MVPYKYVARSAWTPAFAGATNLISVSLKRAPKKPYSGKLMLRLPPEVHARAAMLAEATGKSINAWATEVLARGT